MATLTKRCTKTFKIENRSIHNGLDEYIFTDDFKIGDSKSKIKKYKTLIKEYKNRPFKFLSKGKNCIDYNQITDINKRTKYRTNIDTCNNLKNDINNEYNEIKKAISTQLLTNIIKKIEKQNYSKDNLESISCDLTMLNQVQSNRISIDSIKKDFINKFEKSKQNSNDTTLIKALALKYINTILYNKEDPKKEIAQISEIMGKINKSSILLYDNLIAVIKSYSSNTSIGTTARRQ